MPPETGLYLLGTCRSDSCRGGRGFVAWRGSGSFAVFVRAPADCFGGLGEEVEADPDQGVEELQLGGGVVPVVESVPADDVAVCLLDVGVVVGLIWPGAGEVKCPSPRPLDHGVVVNFPPLSELCRCQALPKER